MAAAISSLTFEGASDQAQEADDEPLFFLSPFPRGDVGLHAVPDGAAVRQPVRPRVQLHPANLAVGPAHLHFHVEVGKLAGTPGLGLDQALVILWHDLPVQRVGIAQDVLRGDAVERFDARTDVKKAGPAVGFMDILINRAVRQVVPQEAQALFALPQGSPRPPCVR